MYIHIYRRLGGEIAVKRRSPPPGNRFRIHVRVVRVGEAKLRGRASGMNPPLPVRSRARRCCPPGWPAVTLWCFDGVPMVPRGV
eukprot:2295068-Pyramimonas_sp.AAC.1